MVHKRIVWNGKTFYLDSTNNYSGFKKRLTQLKYVHPNLKYKYFIKAKQFILYVRKWGA